MAEPPIVLSGISSWKWYLNYVRDSRLGLDAAYQELGKIAALGNPIPGVSGGRKHVLAFGAEANQAVLGNIQAYTPTGQLMPGPRNSAQRRIRRGILAMSGEKHQQHRKVMMPAFSRPAVKSYIPEMADLIDEVLAGWTAGEKFDLYEQMTLLANWIAARILFGHLDFQESSRICTLISEWVHMDTPAIRLFRVNVGPTGYAKTLRYAEVLETEMQALIDEKRRRGDSENDVLSRLIQGAEQDDVDISDADLIAHGVILHAAAFITTASALTWALYLIAQHPHVAAEITDEVDSTLTQWPPTHEQIDNLHCIERALKESLRLFPPVHHTIRNSTGDGDLMGLPVGDGDKVFLSSYWTHRDPDIYADPERYNPSRWNEIRPGPYEYTPFSAGPRLCLGYQFAMTEMKMIIARVLSQHRLEVVPNSDINMHVRLTLSPKNGIPVVAHRNDRQFKASPITGNMSRYTDF